MLARYLRRELSGRRKQTAIIATALALAIALVIVVNALSAGVRDAQKTALAAVYGVGTDITVTKAPAAPTAGAQQGPRFDVGGQTGSGSSASVSQSRLVAGRGASTFAGSGLATVTGTPGVHAASAALSLNNITLNGQLTQSGSATGSATSAPTAAPTAPAQSGAGEGQRGPGGSFGVNSFSVLGVDGGASEVGPLASASVSQGRALGAEDVGQHHAVVDSSYATTAGLALGGTVNVGGTDFTIVGIVTATGSQSETAANVYIPLDVAQTLSSQADAVSTVYVKASSSDQLASVKAALQKALPDETVNTQDDLASNVSGSLANASSLVSGLGLWLSIAVLVAAFLLAALLTLSGVSRRTREFGTLKAIGWRNSMIVRQVAGESLVQSAIGAVGGIAVGLLAVLALNIFAPTLSASAGVGRGFGGQGGPGGQFAGAGQAASQAAQAGATGQAPPGAARAGAAATEVVLGAPVTPAVVLIAVGIAVLGGLLAGIAGGWRAARLQPAEALRSVA